MPSRARWIPIAVVAAALAGIALRAVTLASLDPAAVCGADFPVFRAGAELLGTPRLYSAAAAQAIATREAGCTNSPAIFIRLPFFAAFMRPWTALPFWTAFHLWRLAITLAVAAFVWLWPAPRHWTLLACAWSVPLGYGITNGQDVAFLLLWIALGTALLRRGRPLAAGLVLSLCAAKFHLFFFLPLLAFSASRRLLAGLASGGAALFALCFALQGPDWPRQFLSAVSQSRIDPRPGMLFNLRGIAHGNTPVEILLSAAVVASLLFVVLRGDPAFHLSAILTAGILLSHHLTICDAALLIPVALDLVFHTRASWSRALAVFLVSPPGCFMMNLPALVEFPRLVLLALALLLPWEAARQRRASQPASPAPPTLTPEYNKG